MEFKNLFPEVLHHSYIVEGDIESSSSLLLDFLKEKFGKQIEILYQEYESFKMEDSLLIHEWHLNRTVEGQRRFCVISSKYINHDAERTLLKIIEEPKDYTHFFLVVPNASLLLDTIRSRSHTIKSDQAKDGPSSLNEGPSFAQKEVESFLKMNLKDKLELIGKIVKSHEDDEGGALRFHATLFLNFLEKYFYEKLKNLEVRLPEMEMEDRDIMKILEEINEKRKYLATPGSSPKMILEHMAIMLE